MTADKKISVATLKTRLDYTDRFPVAKLGDSTAYALPASAIINMPYGSSGNGIADNAAAFQNHIDIASALGGGVMYLPSGIYRVNSDIYWASNVGLVGDGMGKSIIMLYGTAQIRQTGTLGVPITDCIFQDIEIDGTNQTGWTKGFFMLYCLRHYYRRVYVHDTGATGFGSDFMVDSVYEDCIADGCGRTGTISTAGCSGFGIGTGKYAVENVSLINCVARNNKRFGAFFEMQGLLSAGYFASRGINIVGGYYEGNQWGVGDCGVRGLSVVGAHINSNLDTGFCMGPSLAAYSGYDGQISDCEISENVGDGIKIDLETTVPKGGYAIANNNINNNGLCGIKLTTGVGAHVISDYSITDNHISGNGTVTPSAGISLAANLMRAHVNRNISTNNAYGLLCDASKVTTDSEIQYNDLRGNMTGYSDNNTNDNSTIANNLVDTGFYLTCTTTGAQTLTLAEVDALTDKSFFIDWGDGSSNAYTGNNQNITHAYAGAGTWTVKFSPATSLKYLSLSDAKLSGTIDATNPIPSRLLVLYLSTIAGLTWTVDATAPMPTGLTSLTLYNMVGITWAVDTPVPMPIGLTSLILLGVNGVTVDIAQWSRINGIHSIRYESTLNQAAVDLVLQGIWNNKANYTYATPTLDLLGTGNAAPSGTYQAASPPTTGEEYKYDLVVGAYTTAGPEWTVTTA
jgi:hypothetical protein